jgi:hypothetical protein
MPERSAGGDFMVDKPRFTKPELIEFGPLTEIVQQADGTSPQRVG